MGKTNLYAEKLPSKFSINKLKTNYSMHNHSMQHTISYRQTMKKITLLLSILLWTTYSNAEHVIDDEMKTCLNKKTNQTTAGMSRCVNNATEQWDNELNRVYNLLLKKLTAEGKDQLLLAQKLWIKQRDQEYNFLNAMYFRQEFSGSMYSNTHVKHINQIVKERTLTLTKYLSFHKNL